MTFLRAVGVGVALAGVCALAGCGGDAELPSPQEYAHELFVGVNAERVGVGLEPLEWSDCVEGVALERAERIPDDVDQVLEHEDLVATCTPGVATGENLARSALPAQEIVDRWMASAGHQANIVNSEFAVGAVGCVWQPVGEVLACSWVAEGRAVVG